MHAFSVDHYEDMIVLCIVGREEITRKAFENVVENEFYRKPWGTEPHPAGWQALILQAYKTMGCVVLTLKVPFLYV